MSKAELKQTKVGKSVDAFRAAHDKSFIVPQRIREGLKKLGDGWEYESDFIKLCGLRQTDFARYREPFLDDHCVTVGGKSVKRCWAGTKAAAEKMREMANG